ncbi:hypothetical protein SCHPADRAFT_939206 [Schizopora paradoxa]|uniref:Uncharacterized protein n=1 Tax=Schizopora paradoxa TaxID=27342 RepID=A0A0H2SCU9_9AGAM|nr:hypothetical protein SCHPADRAFT_939206 [Schizopora paradoxa]
MTGHLPLREYQAQNDCLFTVFAGLEKQHQTIEFAALKDDKRTVCYAALSEYPPLVMKSAVIVILLSVAGLTIGANDWSKACLSGSCSFDIEASPTSMEGTMKISGASSAISDITPAAGWQILDCTDTTNSQTIHLVCTDDSLGCNHLFENGAQDTIVRLPQNCGSGPFVRVVDHWIPSERSIPANTIPRLPKRTSPSLQVHALELDDKFENMAGTHGNVSFTVGAKGNHTVNLQDGNGKTRRKRQNGSVTLGDAAGVFSNSFELSDVNVGTCPGLNFSFNAAQVGLNDSPLFFSTELTITGTMNPKNIETLEFSAPTTAEFNGAFESFIQIQGTSPNTNTTLLTTTFQGMSIDGVVQITPSFSFSQFTEVFADGLATFEGQIDFDFTINSLQFNFPSNNPAPTLDISHQNLPWNSVTNPGLNTEALIFSELTFAVSYTTPLGEFPLTASLKQLVDITAFSKSVQLSVTHLFDIQMLMTSDPVGSSNTEEEICIMFLFDVQTTVQNSGPFFEALPSIQEIFVLEQDFTPANECQTAVLGPAPSISRREKSPLSARAPPSCPAPVPIPTQVIFQGTFP